MQLVKTCQNLTLTTNVFEDYCSTENCIKKNTKSMSAVLSSNIVLIVHSAVSQLFISNK